MYTYVCKPVGVYEHQPHLYSAHRGQKGASDLLEMELQAAERHFIGTGNLGYTLCKSSKCSQLLSHLSIPKIFFFFFLK